MFSPVRGLGGQWAAHHYLYDTDQQEFVFRHESIIPACSMIPIVRAVAGLRGPNTNLEWRGQARLMASVVQNWKGSIYRTYMG